MAADGITRLADHVIFPHKEFECREFSYGIYDRLVLLPLF
jgi:hypothetical protein